MVSSLSAHNLHLFICCVMILQYVPFGPLFWTRYQILNYNLATISTLSLGTVPNVFLDSLFRFWQLKNKISPSTINNHLLFDVQNTVARERGRKSVRFYEQTKRDTPPPTPQPNRTLWTQTSNRQLTDWLLLTENFFLNSLTFIHLNSGYR